MTTTKTKITTDYSRELNVAHSEYDVNLHVKDTDGFYGGKEVYTGLSHGEAAQLAAALLGENATVITDLPEVSQRGHNKGYVGAGDYTRSITNTPEEVLKNAKALLAIHAFLVKRDAEQEEAKKAEAEAAKAKEAARKVRRDELTKELTGNHHTEYAFTTELSQKAIDRIIDLEEAAKVS